MTITPIQMTKLTILCDADDTIENMSEHWIEELNSRYDLSVKKSDIKAWDMRQAFPTLTSDQIYAPLKQSEFWNKIMPIEGSTVYLKEIMERGHDLYIVTSSHYSTSGAKIAKLLELFPFLNWKQIITAHDKQLIHGDVIIDDGMHNLIGNPCPFRFLFNQPHNENIDETRFGVERVYSWKGIYQKIHDIAFHK